jgi:hypothetical protein
MLESVRCLLPTMSDAQDLARDCAHELRFAHRQEPGRALSFPCDAHGHVDIDSLSESARIDYFFARAVVGCVFARPTVLPCAPQPALG